MSVTTTPTATVYESPKLAVRRQFTVPVYATVHTTPRSSVPSSPALSSPSEFQSFVSPAPSAMLSPTIVPTRSSMDSYLDRSRVLEPSATEPVLATTMVSTPRRQRHRLHKKSASASALLPPLPALSMHQHHQFPLSNSPLASPAIPPSSFVPHAAFGSSSLPDIPSLPTRQGLSDIEALILGATPKNLKSHQSNEEDSDGEEGQQVVRGEEEVCESSEDESGEKMAKAMAAAAAFAATTVVVRPLPEQEPEPQTFVAAPVETAVPAVPLVVALPATSESVKMETAPPVATHQPQAIAPASAAPQTIVPDSKQTSRVSPTVAATAPVSGSFLSSWHGRSKAMMPHLPRPSPLMPFHAARKVVTSVRSVGTGLIPSKEQLESFPVAGRILAHPVMDSTLHYIATKRGLPWLDPRRVIKPEDLEYRKLNKRMIQQAMTLSVLAVQKEELSRAIEDEAGDDAFELYLASISTLMHALPIETCDPLRREAFIAQLRDFVDDHQGLVEDPATPNIRSKKLRRHARRRQRHYSNQAMSLVQHHASLDTVTPGQPQQQPLQPQLSRQQQRQQRQQKEQEHRALRQKSQGDRKSSATSTIAPPSPPNSAVATSAAAAAKVTKSKRSSRSRRQSGRRHHHHHELSDDDEDLPEISGSVSSLQNNANNANNNGGLGDSIINTAVHSAIRLKQSPIPDVVKTCLRTSKVILSKVDERFHLQEKAWELSKQSIERAIELDEQYAIHEAVTETIFATVTGLVKAGIAYKETPSYRERRGMVEGANGPQATSALLEQGSGISSAPPSPATMPVATNTARSHDPHRAAAAASTKTSSGFLSGRRLRHFYQRQAVVVDDEMCRQQDESDTDSDSGGSSSSSEGYDSDTRFSPSSTSSVAGSSASTCFSSDEEDIVMMTRG
ncbi:hypothetical protein BG004_000242, partial [Podila humilis]